MAFTESTRLWIGVVFLTLLSGIGDSQGFVHAAKIWSGDQINVSELVKTSVAFGLGITTYLFVVKLLQQLGVTAPEMQTLLWFATTIIGVAIVSGSVLKWQIGEQVVAVLVLIGIGCLVVRTGG